MRRLSREEVDRIIGANPENRRVLAAVAIGEAPLPDNANEADMTRHGEAVKIARKYQDLVGRHPLRMPLLLISLSVMADNFFEKYPEGDPEAAV